MIQNSPLRRTVMSMLLVCAFGGTPIAHAQQSAEQYVPIGQSPGISGEYSVVGKIVAVDSEAHTISVQDGNAVKTLKVTDKTRIWLDRSKRRRENTEAAYEDCEVGRTVEVMHTMESNDVADWIKIESR